MYRIRVWIARVVVIFLFAREVIRKWRQSRNENGDDRGLSTRLRDSTRSACGLTSDPVGRIHSGWRDTDALTRAA
jgi:hypothetical protein